MVNNLDGQEIQVDLSTPSRAGIFRSIDRTENEDVLMLIMPLMVGV